MSLITRNSFLKVSNSIIQAKRFRGKINIQKPKPPHYERSKVMELTRPWFLKQKQSKTVFELCSKNSKLKTSEVENPFQAIIAGELRQWFEKSRLVAFYHMNSMTGSEQYRAYVMFKKEGMHYKNYGRKTLDMAVQGTKHETVLDFYYSRNMTVFSPEPEIRKLLKITKKIPQLVLLAGIYEGKLLNKDQMVALSLYQNLQSAQAQLVQTLNSGASLLHQQLNSHQTTLVSQLQERIKQLKE